MSLSNLRALRRCWYWAGLRATIPLSLISGHYGQSGFGVLMYHRVITPPKHTSTPTWNVPPDKFEAQLRYLLDRGFEPWSVRQLLARLESKQSIPRQAFAVTFDDGYRCVATQAFPILKRLQIPATIFLATGLLSQPGRMHHDDWTDAGRQDVTSEAYEALTLEECDALVTDPLIDFGSHTHTHQDFRGRAADFAADIAVSAQFLENRWKLRNVPFAYPYGCSAAGYCHADFVAAVKRTGFSCGLTADCRIVHPERDDRFRWGRVPATAGDSGVAMAAKLDNWYEVLKTFGRPGIEGAPAT